MNTHQTNTGSQELEKEILLWIEILKLWQNRLHFLKLRIQTVQRSDLQTQIAFKKENWVNQIDFFADSVISDYLDSLALHLSEIREHSKGNLDSSWLKEHHLFRRHLFQLKAEYLKLSGDILNSLEISLVKV